MYTTTPTRTPKQTLDSEAFMALLVTQLRNQDPTNAMDVNKMTEQLVQFSGVEQQVQTNSNLQQLITLQQGNTLTSASNLLGRVIEVESNRLSLQNSQAALRLPAAGAHGAELRGASGRITRPVAGSSTTPKRSRPSIENSPMMTPANFPWSSSGTCNCSVGAL